MAINAYVLQGMGDETVLCSISARVMPIMRWAPKSGPYGSFTERYMLASRTPQPRPTSYSAHDCQD